MNDPRKECKTKCIPTIDTPINECPCYLINDPRKDSLCKTIEDK
jgi:hypothetical protein